MAVNDKQTRYLRSLAHPLKPVIMIGNKGLTDNVIAETDNALERHELIKVRISGADKAERQQLITALSEQTQSDVIMIIGHIVAIYRPSKEPTIQLPK